MIYAPVWKSYPGALLCNISSRTSKYRDIHKSTESFYKHNARSHLKQKVRLDRLTPPSASCSPTSLSYSSPYHTRPILISLPQQSSSSTSRQPLQSYPNSPPPSIWSTLTLPSTISAGEGATRSPRVLGPATCSPDD